LDNEFSREEEKIVITTLPSYEMGIAKCKLGNRSNDETEFVVAKKSNSHYFAPRTIIVVVERMRN